MRRIAAALLCLAFALATPAAVEAAGAIFKLGKVIAKGGKAADEAAGAASDAATIRRMGQLSPELRAAVQGREAENIAAAYQKVEVASLIGTVKMDMPAFNALLRQSAAARASWDDGVALSDDMPNVIVKAPRIPGASEALRLFAERRLGGVLAEPFDVADVKVVATGLADDAARSATELAAFRRTIPSANWDEVGYLRRIADAPLDHAEMVRRLQIYEGKTIILVGHVPERTADFVIHVAGGGVRRLELDRLLAAAAEARVNIIPIGCNSEALGPIGARGLLNSKRVRLALRDVIDERPQTVADFLNALTRRDLNIVIDPLEARLFSNGVAIRDRRTGEVIAQLSLNGLRAVRGFAGNRSSGFVNAELQAEAQACFASASAEAFDGCVGGLRKRDAALVLAEERACRVHNLKVLPGIVAEAQSSAAAARRTAVLSGGFFLAMALLLGWLGIVAARARDDERDLGYSIGHLFNRWRWREVRATVTGGSATEAIAGERLVIPALILALAIGFFAIFAIGEEAHWAWLILYGLCGLMLAGVAIDYGKRMFTENSLVNGVIALTAAAILASAWNYVSAEEDAWTSKDTATSYTEALREARSAGPAGGGCYRHGEYGLTPQIMAPVPVTYTADAPPPRTTEN